MATLLLIDDDRLMLRVLQLMLERAQYRVLAANCLDDALLLLNHHRPEVILLDEIMPGISSGELCSYLKQHPHGAEAAIILHAAGLEQPDLENLQGVDAVLRKPSHPRVLLAQIERCLSARV